MAARLAQRAPVVVQPVVDDEPEETGDYVPAVESDAPVGPNADEESEYLGGESLPGELPLVAPPSKEVEDDEPPGELPKLGDLNKRIPADALAIMDELFRAKFSKVQRIPARHLKKS